MSVVDMGKNMQGPAAPTQFAQVNPPCSGCTERDELLEEARVLLVEHEGLITSLCPSLKTPFNEYFEFVTHERRIWNKLSGGVSEWNHRVRLAACPRGE